MAGSRPRRCKRNAAWNREWARQHVEAQGESGLSVQDFCFAYGLPVHIFYGWRRRLNREAAGPSNADNRLCPPVQPIFAEVIVVSPEPVSPEPIVQVVLQGGRRLEVSPDFDEGELRRLVALLESLPC